MPHPRRARGGPRSPFGAKSLPNRSHSLTPLAKRILSSNAARLKTSESNLVEVAVRLVRWGADDEAIRHALSPAAQAADS